MAAALNGNVDIVTQLVLEGGASLCMTDSRGSTALVYAVKGGHIDVVEFLLSCEKWLAEDTEQTTNNPATLNTNGKCDQLGETLQEALVWASKLGHMEILEIILRNENAVSVNINKRCVLTGKK